ncbi:MAG: hypothetical protein QW156_05050 [Candidatus Aenigmatarchaeota archaeon]
MIKFLKKFWQIYWEDYEVEVLRDRKNRFILFCWYWLWIFMFIIANFVAFALIYAGFVYHWFAFIGSIFILAFSWFMLYDYTKSGGQYR